MHQDLIELYGNRVRIRVCGVCWIDKRLLLVNHASLTDSDFWAPPGGGVEFGTTVDQNLKRELKEETGLVVRVEEFLFACEYLKEPLHSLELFFRISIQNGGLVVGTDPELPIIKDVRFVSEEELAKIPAECLHGILRDARTETQFRKLAGFYRI
jgi:8-oxo-dGTP diphosphatase